jgi:hypothetical protein
MHAFREDGRILKLVAGLTATLIGAVLYTARIADRLTPAR